MTITYVTITYNAAQVLQRTLDSVLQQDYPDIVHLIIDGASTDGTIQLIDDYVQRSNAADNGHRIQVTSEPDHGIYDAMNKGLRSLDGDYVCFLNAGDFLPAPDIVSKMVPPTTACLPCFTAIRTSSMAKADFSTIVALLPRRTSLGSLSVRVCSSVIRLSMPVPTLPLPLLMTCSTAIRPMSIGASV